MSKKLYKDCPDCGEEVEFRMEDEDFDEIAEEHGYAPKRKSYTDAHKQKLLDSVDWMRKIRDRHNKFTLVHIETIDAADYSVAVSSVDDLSQKIADAYDILESLLRPGDE